LFQALVQALVHEEFQAEYHLVLVLVSILIPVFGFVCVISEPEGLILVVILQVY
jgi:hypothetical protein